MAKFLLLFVLFTKPLLSTIHIFGDSHSQMFTGFFDTKIHYLGPITMHRIGRDNSKFIHLEKYKMTQSDTVMMVFGEIDIRCHIKKIADRLEVAANEVIDDLAKRFCQGIKKITCKLPPKQVIICAIIPPVDVSRDPLLQARFERHRFPVLGTYQERLHYNQQLNYALAAQCAHFGFRFFEYRPLVQDHKGCLDPALADSTVHIHPDHRYIVQNALKQFLPLK